MLTAEHKTAALVALAPALGFKNRMAYLAPWLHKPWAFSTDPAEEAKRHAQSPNYPNFPTAALVQLSSNGFPSYYPGSGPLLWCSRPPAMTPYRKLQ